MMTIKDLREILIHFTESKYNDYEVRLWDYQNQRELSWGPSHSLSHPDREITFPVTVEPVDGVDIDERLKKIVKEFKEKGGENVSEK